MKYSFLSLIIAAFLMAFVACNDDSTIGNNLSDEDITIVVDSTFTVTGSTQSNSVVQSRTLSQLLGEVDAPGFGAIHSDFVCQYMPSLGLDTTGVKASDIDSVKLFMQMQRGAFIGDSLAPMGVQVYRITKDLPYPIYSNFDPKGYYDPSPIASGTYNASTINEPDSLKKYSFIYTTLSLPVSFGRELYAAYEDNPASFADPAKFANDVFKGFYVRSSYGSGRITDFNLNSISLYYHKVVKKESTQKDTTLRFVGHYFAATPEMVINNNIHYEPAPELKQMIAAGDQVLAAPAGYDIELRFPAPEVLASYNKYANDLRVLNTVSFSIPADSIANDYGIAPPPYALLVLKKDKADFFANNKLTDNKTSFYAAYNSSTHSYTFSMRSYMMHLLELDNLTADDYTFSLTPVQVDMELSANSGYYGQSYVVSRISPYVSKPAMTKISLKDAKIKLTFSTGKDKNL